MKIPFQINLSGRVAAVTGGGGVLCSDFAKALAACGAKVAVLGRRKEALDTVVAEIVKAGGCAAAFACDVLDKEALTKTNAAIEALWGPVDILINGAGGNHPSGTAGKEFCVPEDMATDAEKAKTFYGLDPQGIQGVFSLNFLGTLLPTQVFTQAMTAKGKGIVVNISSMAGDRPLTKICGYSGAKAAIMNFTQWLAVHLAKSGVRVNAIAPGFFVTEQNRTLLKNPDGSLTPRSQKILANTPMGRFGEAQELLGTLLWLVSDDASGFVTGVVIPVDGGFSAYSGV